MSRMIHEKQDLTYLNWTKTRNSSGAAGSFLKAYSEINGKKLYYKLSNYDTVNGVVGHECVNEIIADRLLTILGIEHLSYTLINADIIVDGRNISTYLCMSENFRRIGEDKTALDTYDCIVRECQEELGITLIPRQEIICIDNENISLHFIEAEIACGELTLNEHESAEWISKNDAERFEFCPADKKALEYIW